MSSRSIDSLRSLAAFSDEISPSRSLRGDDLDVVVDNEVSDLSVESLSEKVGKVRRYGGDTVKDKLFAVKKKKEKPRGD